MLSLCLIGQTKPNDTLWGFRSYWVIAIEGSDKLKAIIKGRLK